MTRPAGDFEKLLDEVVWPHSNKAKVLLIGTGSTEEQYTYWPERFQEKWATNICYLEVWWPNCERWASGPVPIVCGDVRDAWGRFANRSWDIVMLNQGIEHFHRSEFGKVLDIMFDLSARVAIATCPFGSRYDNQGEVGGNPYEKHVSGNLTAADFANISGWTVEEFGQKDAGDAQVAIWRVR